MGKCQWMCPSQYLGIHEGRRFRLRESSSRRPFGGHRHLGWIIGYLTEVKAGRGPWFAGIWVGVVPDFPGVTWFGIVVWFGVVVASGTRDLADNAGGAAMLPGIGVTAGLGVVVSSGSGVASVQAVRAVRIIRAVHGSCFGIPGPFLHLLCRGSEFRSLECSCPLP